MTGYLRLAAVLMVAACPAFARPSSPGLPPRERCIAWIDDLHAGLHHDDSLSVTALADGGCRFGRVGFEAGMVVAYDISVLEVHGIDFNPSHDFGPPMSIRFDARGIRETRTGLSGAQEWMVRQIATPFDVVVDLTFDPVTKAVMLHELSLTGQAVGRVEFDCVVEGTDELEEQNSTRFGLRALHLKLNSEYFLTRFVLPATIGLSAEPDPADAIARGKLQATLFLSDALPRAGASPATIAAILGVIADLPRIRHPFELTVTAPAGPITPHDVEHAADGPDGVAALMAKLRVESSYAGPFSGLERMAP